MNKIENTTINKKTFLPLGKFKNGKISTFLIRFLGLYLLWKVGFSILWNTPSLMDAYREFSLFVIEQILYHTKFLLGLFSYTTELDLVDRSIRIVGKNGVTVGEPCIGFGVMAVFTALILSYPGAAIKKLWFIPMGLFLIHVVNIIRIALLTILVEIDPALWELNHKFIFKIVVYGIVFLLWTRWMKIAKT